MRFVRIVTDETSNLEEEFAKKKGITIIPFNVINKKGKAIKISTDGKENPEEGLFSSKDSFFRYLDKAKKKKISPPPELSLLRGAKNISKRPQQEEKTSFVSFPLGNSARYSKTSRELLNWLVLRLGTR